MQRPFFQPESAPKISLFSRPFAKTSGRDSQRLLAGYTELLGKTIAAAEFQAKYLRLINEMGEDGEPVTITDRGWLVA